MAQDVKSVAGVLVANVKSVAGVLIADVKTIAGVDNTSGGGGGGPIVEWKMNDNGGSGTTLAGTGSLADNGTTNAGWATGLDGANFCLDFNGSSHEAHSNAAIAFGTNIISVSFWFRCDVAGTTVIVESSADFNSNANAWVVFIDGTVNVHAYMAGAAGVTRSAVLTGQGINTVYHIVVIFDGSTSTGVVKIYRDGTLESPTPSGNRSSTANFATYVLYCGARNSSSLFFDGKIDDVKIYSGEIDASAVAALYAAGPD